MSEAQKELFALLATQTPDVIAVLRQRVIDGLIRGQTYWIETEEIPACGCVYGTIAFAHGLIDWEADMRDFIFHLKNRINSGGSLEGNVWLIRLGDTPATNSVSRDLLTWIDEYLEQVPA